MLGIDKILPMDTLRSGLAEIVNRRVLGKLVMIVESADWAATSPPFISPPIPLGGELTNYKKKCPPGTIGVLDKQKPQH